MMWRTLILLNLYSRQAVGRKLKKGLKHKKKASINTYPKDQSMKFWQKLLSFWWRWKTQLFWVGHFEFFFSKKKFFFCFILIQNWSQFMRYQGFFEILMFTLISSKNLGVEIMRNTVNAVTGGLLLFQENHPWNAEISFECKFIKS